MSRLGMRLGIGPHLIKVQGLWQMNWNGAQQQHSMPHHGCMRMMMASAPQLQWRLEQSIGLLHVLRANQPILHASSSLWSGIPWRLIMRIMRWRLSFSVQALSCEFLLMWFLPFLTVEILSNMMPGTCHYVITLQHAITWGHHFIAAATISWTVIGIVHTFILDLGLTNALHNNTRTLIWQIMIMWIDALDSDESNPGMISTMCWGYPLLTIHCLNVPNQPCTPTHQTFHLLKVSWTLLLLAVFFRWGIC